MKQNEILLRLKDVLHNIFCKILWNSFKVLENICATFIHFSSHGWKLMKANKYLTNFPSHFSKMYHFYFWTITELNEKYEILQNLWNYMTSKKNFMVQYFDFVQFCLLEQYFKRHPATKFNKTPSAKYILL